MDELKVGDLIKHRGSGELGYILPSRNFPNECFSVKFFPVDKKLPPHIVEFPIKTLITHLGTLYIKMNKGKLVCSTSEISLSCSGVQD